MRLTLNEISIEDYRRFLAIKSLPTYRVRGHTAEFPDEYLARVGMADAIEEPETPYVAPSWMFDYQRAIVETAIRKQKYAIFADCGLGKTPMLLEFARHAAANLPASKCVLIVSPLMVVKQTLGEVRHFYPKGMDVEHVHASELNGWLASGSSRIGITNYDALTDDIEPGRIGALILDESSMLKSHYGKWGQTCIRLSKGLRWKLACTGTPAPNDRIEYANHAVFLDAYPTINAFLARFFVNRGQTDNRWELKPHALQPFYRALSHWCIFLTNPATFGWKDNATGIPPIHVHIHDVKMTQAQTDLVFSSTGSMFADQAGGITSRSVLSQIGKGNHRGEKVETLKPAFIRLLVDSWPTESTIIWCHFNAEQEGMAATFPEAANITGDTPIGKREELIDDFKAGRKRILISKPRILGFGLNLQICTRQVWSGLQDSYEEFYQGVKRSNRIGSTKPLNVHIPVTDVERPMIDTVLRKAKMVQRDTENQERIFKAAAFTERPTP